MVKAWGLGMHGPSISSDFAVWYPWNDCITKPAAYLETQTDNETG